MIFKQITLNNTIRLHELGIIEDIEYNKLSRPIIEHDRALKPSHIQGRKREAKDVTVYLRVIKEKREETKKQIDKIVGLSYSESPILFNGDGKYCEAILLEADSSLYFQYGLVILLFSNRDGQWYGEEKSATIGTSFNAEGVIGTDWATLELTPSGASIRVQLDDMFIRLFNVSTTENITIDLKSKRAMQNGAFAQLDPDSKFFELKLGSNLITGSNTGGTIKYREVVAL